MEFTGGGIYRSQGRYTWYKKCTRNIHHSALRIHAILSARLYPGLEFHLHREIFWKSYWINSKSDCIYHFPVWNQTDVRLVPNQSESIKYNLIRKYFSLCSRGKPYLAGVAIFLVSNFLRCSRIVRYVWRKRSWNLKNASQIRISKIYVKNGFIYIYIFLNPCADFSP